MKFANALKGFILCASLNLTIFAADQQTTAESQDFNATQKINWEDRFQMFTAGTVTVKDQDTGKVKGKIEIRYLPGASNVVQDAAEHWAHAEKTLASYTERESFWKKKVGSCAKHGVDFIVKVNKNHGVGAIPRDIKNCKENCDKINGQELGGGATKLGLSTVTGFKILGRCLISVFGTVVGVIETALAPTIATIYPLLSAAVETAASGVVKPFVLLTWNGAAWTVSQVHTEMPTTINPNSIVLKWIPAESNDGATTQQ